MKRVAVIDFGSNAIRLTIADVVSNGKYTVVEKIRYPVRIGTDVFTSGTISDNKLDEVFEVFRKFRSHIRYYHADEFEVEAVATSALRDASNFSLVIQKIEEFSGIKVRLISGMEEAELIANILRLEFPDLKGDTLLVDIGGGSTELIFLKDSAVLKLESFNNGTLRSLKDSDLVLLKMKEFIHANTVKGVSINIVGTGGNLRRLGKLRKKIFGSNTGVFIKKEEVLYIYNEFKKLSIPESMIKYDLKKDRAEVITPALKIFSAILDEVESSAIYLPKIGLSDSLLSKISLKTKPYFYS